MNPKVDAPVISKGSTGGTEVTDRPTLSVVIACLDAGSTIADCLRAVCTSCHGIEHETILLHASDERLAALVAANYPEVITVDALIPEMWASGLHASTGETVAFTTGHFVVSPGWAGELLSAIADGVAGAGGPIALRRDAGLVGRAVYFLRYSTFIPPLKGGVVTEIAGDNAVYSRASLSRHRDTFAGGFWEVEFHRLIREDGEFVIQVPTAVAEVGRSFRFPTIIKHRFEHGLRFGSYRTGTAGEPIWRVFLAAPFVPLVLGARIAARAARKGQAGNFLLSLPALLPLLTAWAFGEALGAVGISADAELTSSIRGE